MHIRTNKNLNRIFRLVVVFCEWLGVHYPKTLMRIRYFARFHRPLNIKDPQTLNEKILYLSLCTDTTLWTRCADKYRVREYVKECGLEDILIGLLGVWKEPRDIDFSKLPDKFVLKGNHGCGDIFIITDKSNLDKEKIVRTLEKDLKEKYGALEAGMHYMRIDPVAIAEEYLENDEETLKVSDSLIDYKIWCFNGKASYVWVSTNRHYVNGQEIKETMVYDRDWQPHPDYLIYDKGYIKAENLAKPKNFEKMLEVAEKLSKPFPQVRCDLYNVSGKIFFGELTFTGYGGLMTHYTEEFQKLAGSLIDLSGVKVIK